VLFRSAALPALNGHCIDGDKTRVTITSDTLPDGRIVWQVGGEVAEIGHTMTEANAIAHTRRELLACIPGLDTTGCEWSTYLAPRAEGKTSTGRRPETPTIIRERNIVTAWPSKLVAAPLTADLILKELPSPVENAPPIALPPGWGAPKIAQLPWEREIAWIGDGEIRR